MCSRRLQYNFIVFHIILNLKCDSLCVCVCMCMCMVRLEIFNTMPLRWKELIQCEFVVDVVRELLE